MSAAAGSGKTAVLTERAVRLITDLEHPVDADRLLIVTFTNAAAAELRARIGQALLRRCQQEPGNTALRRQRMLLQRAPICTMDAFCLDLLHKHFQALDIPPDFAPADPGSVELLRTAALAETLEHAYADQDFCAFADLYGKGRTDKPAGTPSCRCMISCGHCRTTTASWTNFWLHGSRKTALTPPAGMTCCWRRQPAMQRRPASCCAPPNRTAGKTTPRK